MKFSFRRGAACPAVFLLVAAMAGCGHVSPVAMARLAMLDPVTVDPGQLTVALVVPPGFALVPGTARLDLTATRGNQRLAQTVTLAERPADPTVPVPTGSHAIAYRLSGADAKRMRDWQAQVAGWKAQGPATGTLGIGVDGCLTGAGLAPTAQGAVYVQLAQGEGFLPLLPPAPLTAILGASVMAAVQPCTQAQ